MRKIYCKKCDDYTPHRYCGHENDFDEDGPLMRAFAAVVTVGLTEIFANKTLFYKCKCCGHVTSEDI